MAFTVGELANIANATLDYHLKGVKSQHVQNKPLMKALEAKAKPFAGANTAITERVKGVNTTGLQGYTHNDAVTYNNPANIKVVSFPWKELHAGITVTLTELKTNGVQIVDTENGRKETSPGDVEMIQLVNLLEDKLDDMTEGSQTAFHAMLWKDGTQDAKEIPGIRSMILNNPAAAAQTVGGLATDTNTWWRNRAALALNPATIKLANKLQTEFRQLGRYTPNPKWEMFAGSAWLDVMESELRASGTYTQDGWAKSGAIDVSMSDVGFKGKSIQYDPMLDTLALDKYLFVLDMNAIKLRPMKGEAWKKHNPARSPTQYAIYRAVTYTGGLTVNQLNSSGIYSIV